MSEWTKSTEFGGIYASSLHAEYRNKLNIKQGPDFERFSEKIEKFRKTIEKFGENSKKQLYSIKKSLHCHLREKQELYWPVFVAIALLCFVFVSKIAFAEMISAPNNLPIKDSTKLNVIGFSEKKGSEKTCLSDGKNEIKIEGPEKIGDLETDLKEDVARIVKNTPMAAMIDPISREDRIVAAFIVGIAMKESKFGVYAPHVGGRDCYNYWGLKAGGKTTAGGYTCFSSPEEAVSTASKTLEKMIAKGVRTPAQAISWKCGSSCAGQDPSGVRKWIADVGVNFYKINS